MGILFAVLMFVLAFFASFVGFIVIALTMIAISGGAITECDRGDCGAVGEWVYEHSLALLVVITATSLVAASIAVWMARPGREGDQETD